MDSLTNENSVQKREADLRAIISQSSKHTERTRDYLQQISDNWVGVMASIHRSETLVEESDNLLKLLRYQ